jgi:hypothetical protein
MNRQVGIAASRERNQEGLVAMKNLPGRGGVPRGRDSRRFGRVGADIPVQLHGSDFRGTLPARSRDLSAGGLCIATSSAFVLKSVNRVTLGLPSGALTVSAEGRWQRDAPADGMVLSGIEFIDPSPDAVETLNRLVYEIGRSLAQFLSTESELEGLGLEEILGLAHITRFRDLVAGGSIYRQDTARTGEDSIFVVGKGTVVLQVRVRGVTEVLLARLGPGQVFGGMPLIGGAQHGDSAIADTDVRILEIDQDAYRYLKTARPKLAEDLAFVVARAYRRRLNDALVRLRDPD